MSEITQAIMVGGNTEGAFSGQTSWGDAESSKPVGEMPCQNSVRAAVGAVMHFFGNQMTSSRPEEALRIGSKIQRSGGYCDAPITEMGRRWVES